MGIFSLSVNFSVNPLIQIVGCQPEASPVMLESVRAGRVVDWESQETLSGFSMRTKSCWMWWSSGWIMSLSRLPLIFFWRAKRLALRSSYDGDVVLSCCYIAHCVLCKVYFSAQLNKLRPILKFEKYYLIEHIFVPACSSARKIHFFKF